VPLAVAPIVTAVTIPPSVTSPTAVVLRALAATAAGVRASPGSASGPAIGLDRYDARRLAGRLAWRLNDARHGSAFDGWPHGFATDRGGPIGATPDSRRSLGVAPDDGGTLRLAADDGGPSRARTLA
jgi:hypothetical protein